MSDVDYQSLPFAEAVEHLRDKLNVKTAKWADMLHGAHTRAFTVAGATKDGMLVDFHDAINKAIQNGTTLEDFRKDFDTIVQKYGWDYNGSRGWRTRTIYETNLRTAYAAGRYAQMTDPDVLRYQPYWRYRHSDEVRHPRPEHLKWDGLVLKADDPWWKTHMPPNGWGCKCWVEPLTRRELKALDKDGPDDAPPIELQKKTLNTSAGPLTIEVPKGIDPGWGYNVGESAFGRKLADDTMKAWEKQKSAAWDRLTPGDWKSSGRPEQVPVDDIKSTFGGSVSTQAEFQKAIEKIIGGPERTFTLADGDPLLIDAAAMADHMKDDLDRAAFLSALPELINNPYEIWLSFEQHKGTGQVALKKRLVKVVQDAKKRGLVLVAHASAGRLEGLSLIPARNVNYVQKQRVGRLLWGRES